MTITYEAPIETATVIPVGRHRDHQRNMERSIVELAMLTKATLIVAGAGLLGALAGAIVRVGEAVSTGSWMVVLAGLVSIILLRAEQVIQECARTIGRKPDGVGAGAVTDDPETVPVARDEVRLEGSRTDSVEEVRRPVRAGSGTESGTGAEGAPAHPAASHDAGKHRVAPGATTPAPLRVRKLHSGSRKRFAMVHHQVARFRREVPTRASATAVRPIDFGSFRPIARW